MAMRLSVVIVTQERPDALALCLKGLCLQNKAEFEVIVVGDDAARTCLEQLSLLNCVKFVPFRDANISKARNRGISVASGDIVAFLDDDCVPFSDWAENILLGFKSADVHAVGGRVLGPDGLTDQYPKRWVLPSGECTEVPSENLPLKTEGTNMAVRLDTLKSLGGFDERYLFYLDETDLNTRMFKAGFETKIQDTAVVHHGFLESRRRRKDRTPRTLFEVGASTQVFIKSFNKADDFEPLWQEFFYAQKRGILNRLISGRLEPRDVERLLAELKAGRRVGNERAASKKKTVKVASEIFLQFPAKPRIGNEIEIRAFGMFARRGHAKAAQISKTANVSLVLGSLFLKRDRRYFHSGGYWVHLKRFGVGSH